MFVTAIVVAAGKGRRLKSKTPKPLINLGGKPIIIYSLKALSAHPLIKEIIVVTNSLSMRQVIAAIKQHKINKIKTIVLGGARRQDSVYNGLRVIWPQTDLVLIHDGVRPFIDVKILSSLIKAAKLCGAAIVGVPVTATIKKVKAKKGSGAFLREVKAKVTVVETINRENLWEIQTPQVFKKSLILNAYKKFGNIKATDDAMLVEKMSKKVSVVLGSSHNIKITTPEDLMIAKAILKCKTV